MYHYLPFKEIYLKQCDNDRNILDIHTMTENIHAHTYIHTYIEHTYIEHTFTQHTHIYNKLT